METAIEVIQKQLKKQENIFNSEFTNRRYYMYDFKDKELYDSFINHIKVIRDLRKAINFLNTQINVPQGN